MYLNKYIFILIVFLGSQLALADRIKPLIVFGKNVARLTRGPTEEVVKNYASMSLGQFIMGGIGDYRKRLIARFVGADRPFKSWEELAPVIVSVERVTLKSSRFRSGTQAQHIEAEAEIKSNGTLAANLDGLLKLGQALTSVLFEKISDRGLVKFEAVANRIFILTSHPEILDIKAQYAYEETLLVDPQFKAKVPAAGLINESNLYGSVVDVERSRDPYSMQYFIICAISNLKEAI